MELQPGPGLVLGGTYRIERLIGEGGMGSVYEASHLRLPRRFAVKLIHRHIAMKLEVFERFKREAEIASAIGHEHIVEAFDFNQSEEGIAYIVMELLEGEHLRSRLDAYRTLSLEQTVDILDQICGAVVAANARGIVHRDLKPENIFLCRRSGRDFVKVLDFGVSKLMHAATISGETGHPIGTPHYMAPEQASETMGPVDQRADVFALGTMTYECLTGAFAFEAPTPLGVMHAVLHATPVPLRDRRPDVPPAVQAVIERAMEKKADNRYPNVRAFRAALLDACGMASTETLSSAPSPVLERSGASSTGAEVRVEVAGGSRRAPAHVETLVATDNSDAERGGSKPASGRRALGYGALGLTVVVGASWFVLFGSAPKRDAQQAPTQSAAGSAPSPPPTTVASSAATVDPASTAVAARTVEIRLRIEPPDARVALDGVETKENPLRLPYSGRPHKLVVGAAGFATQSRDLFGIADGELRIELKPERAPLPANRAGPSAPLRSAEPPVPSARPASSLGPVERSL